MHITSLSLKNFRNYENQQIKFSPNTNIIYGNNAQGKTNLLEGVYLFSQGKSHRAKRDNELIRFGSEFAELELEFENSERSFDAWMRLSKSDKKKIKINDVNVAKLSMLMNYLNTVMFTPEDLNLIKGSPVLRRRFLDFAISQLLPNYLNTLIIYYKTLEQKNSLLKALRSSRISHDDSLSVWNMQLAQANCKLLKYRIKFINELNSYASQIHSQISKEKLEILYTPSLNFDIMDIENTEIIFSKLEDSQAKEIDAGTSLFGVHRDDLKILIDNKDAKVYASQGQQRTAVLSMKIAQTEYVYSIKEEYPVLLLDDIMSELDSSRRLFLADKIKDKQVLITCTDADAMMGMNNVTKFLINNGSIEIG